MAGPWEDYQQQPGDGPWTDYQKPDTSIGARAGRFGMGAVRGARDVVDAGAQLLTRLGEQLPGAAGEFMKGQRQDVERINREGEAEYQKGRQGIDGIDWGRLTGNVAASAPLAVVVPGAGAATMAGRIGYGVGTGVIAGAAQPVETKGRTTTDLITGQQPEGDNFWTEKAKQVGIGGVMGGAMSGAFEAGRRILSPRVTPEAQTLLNEGVRLTPGQKAGGMLQTFEDKASSFIPTIKGRQSEGLDDFMKATADRALAPIGAKVPATVKAGRETMAFVHEKIRDAYNKLLPNMTFQADGTLMANVQNLQRLAKNLHPDRTDQFNSILKGEFLGKINPNTGVMSGETFNRAQSEVGRLARKYLHSQVADESELGRALTQLHSEMLDGIARTNPMRAAEFSKVRSAAADVMRMDHAASMLGAENGRFTPAHLMNAVKRMDETVRHNSFAEGSARGQTWAEAGKSVLSQKYPDSGTAGRTFLGAAGLGYLSPEALATALGGSALYTKPGMKVLDAALYGGGPMRQTLLDALARLAPLGAPSVSSSLPGVPNQ